MAIPTALYSIGVPIKTCLRGPGCAAGGDHSYMSVMAVANSLMLDFRTIIVPRFVYAGGDDIPESGELSSDICDRIAQFGAEFQRLARAIHTA